MRNRTNNFHIFFYFAVIKAEYLIYRIIGQISAHVMKTIFFIGLFNVNSYLVGREKIRMSDFRLIVKSQKWIHHKKSSFLSKIFLHQHGLIHPPGRLFVIREIQKTFLYNKETLPTG